MTLVIETETEISDGELMLLNLLYGDGAKRKTIGNIKVKRGRTKCDESNGYQPEFVPSDHPWELHIESEVEDELDGKPLRYKMSAGLILHSIFVLAEISKTPTKAPEVVIL